jgi:hypothetical protein
MLFDDQGPLVIVLILSMVVPLIILAIVCWIFWRTRHDT